MPGANKAMAVRILVAEDEPLVALSFCDLFEAEDYEVGIAQDGAAALAEAQRVGEALDVLVTDLNMPRMGGEDLPITHSLAVIGRRVMPHGT